MPSNRSVANIKDGTSHTTFTYQKIDPASGAPFDNTKVTAVSIAVYNAEDSTSIQASTAATWDATIQAWRYVLTYSGAARRAVAVMTPTRAVGVSAALTPVMYEWVDLADTLNRIDVDVAAAQATDNANRALIIAEIDAKAVEMEGAGFVTGSDSLRQLSQRLGVTGDTGGSSTAGTSDAKLNAILVLLGLSGDAAGATTVFGQVKQTDADVLAKAAEIEGTGYNAATDNLHQAKLQRDSLTTLVSALDLRNSTALLMPTFFVQGKTYTVYLRVKDDNGVAVDADATPTFSLLEGTVTGVTLSVFTRDSVGNYHATIAIASNVAVDTTFAPRANWNRTEGSIVNAEEATRYGVVDSFESDSAQTLANTNTILNYLTNSTYGLSALQVIMADIQTKINNGTYGLAALRTDIDAVAAQVGVDNTATLQQKLGAFTTTLNLFAMLGAFTQTETVLKAVQSIQGMI